MATSHSSPIEAKDVAPQPADVPTTSAQNVVDVTASNAVVPIHTTMSGATPGTTREVERHERLATAADRPAKPSRRASQPRPHRSEEHTSELQSLMRITYGGICLKKKTNTTHEHKH